jgi:integrase
MARLGDRLKAGEVPRLCRVNGMHPDGRGLYLCVTSPGAASWVFRYMLDGKAHMMGLGPFPDVSLRQARQAAERARSLKAQRIDPIDQRRAQRKGATSAASTAKVTTFKAAAERFIKSKQSGWKHQGKTAGQWRAAFRDWVYPIIGEISVAEVDFQSVLAVLTQRVKGGEGRFWEVRPETASRCRSRIQSVLDFAKVMGERSGDNPARWTELKFILPKRRDVRSIVHHGAMPHERLPRYLATLRTSSALSARALEFTILTAARTTEVRGMTWSEVDLQAKEWTVPRERMKMKKPHRVPLTDRMIAILQEFGPRDADDYVFPGDRPGRPISENTMLNFLQKSEGHAVTVHGFRSSFSDWVRDETDFSKDLAEAALAHAVGSAVERSYVRTDFFARRRNLMDAWDQYCASHEKRD